MKRDELVWNDMSLDSKGMPMVGPSMAEEETEEVFW